MKRRDFLKSLIQSAGVAGVAGVLPTLSQLTHAAPYSGKLVITLLVSGGWDPLIFCDPKPAFRTLDGTHNWTPSSSGNFAYAPFYRNLDDSRDDFAAFFFQKYRDFIMLINGVDSQTNAHSKGRQNWVSGTLAGTYPTLGAAFAHTHGPDLPLGYLAFGRERETAGLVPYTNIPDPTHLASIARVNQRPRSVRSSDGKADIQFNSDAVMDRIEQASLTRMNRALQSNTLLPRERRALELQLAATENAIELENILVPTSIDRRDANGDRNRLVEQAQTALLSMQAGLCCSADMNINGFDTHSDSNNGQADALSRLIHGIDYLWEKAIELGIHNRLTVFVTSDFGRTPEYNDNENGTDHWSTGSTLIMEHPEASAIGNRVIGRTNDKFEALAINPSTLKLDDSGIIMTPGHIHKAIRDHLGVAGGQLDQFYHFNELENLDIFDPAKST